LKISQQDVFKKWRGPANSPAVFWNISNGAITMNAQLHSTSVQETELERCAAEAAQYALLRRLAPVIRHNMAGTLQPIAMVAAMLERRLQKADADPETLLRNARDIVALSKEAAASCVDLMGWLAPRENRSVQAGKGIAECLGMVATQLSFKGFSIVDNTSQIDVELSQSALRNVLTGAIITLTDAATGPGALRIETEFTDGIFSIQASLGELNVSASARAPENSSYRQLQWHDLEALALREAVQLTHTENRIALLFETSPVTPDRLAEAVQA
jgi:hypothetical protein